MLRARHQPFWVQRYDNGKWGTLMIGPDVGSAKASVALEAGESKEFAFRLNDSGRMRLRLNYWRGSISKLNCTRRRRVRSWRLGRFTVE